MPLDVEISLETAPSVVWDAMIVPDGQAAARHLRKRGHALEFLKDQYRHCKPILLIGAAQALLDAAGIPPSCPRGRRILGCCSSIDSSRGEPCRHSSTR